MHEANNITQPTHITEPGTEAKAAKPRLRLDFLDGLRGLAALYIVLFHAQLAVTTSHASTLSEWLTLANTALKPGRYAVAVFIVLSGYCLMLPVARSADGKLRGGFKDYIKRRARRILPPYYVCLALSLLVLALVPGLRTPANVWWDHALPAFTPGVILSHLFVVHNFSWDWMLKINGSLWSVATEWHIYFLFPAILLPVWRRFGLITLIVVGFALGLLPGFLHERGILSYDFHDAAPWFAGLFAIGMAGAVVGFSEKPMVKAWREKAPWGVFAALFFAIFAGIAMTRPGWLWWPPMMWKVDAIVGGATICLIIHYTRHLTLRSEKPKPDVLALMESRPVTKLGEFSYSLYLVHAPVLGFLHLHLREHNITGDVMFGVMIGVGTPAALLIAWLFYQVCERHFVTAHTAKPKPNVSPVPITTKPLPQGTSD